MREYLISVIGASLLSSLICGWIPDGTEARWVRFAAGLTVAVTVLSPVQGMMKQLLPDIQMPEEIIVQNPYLMDAFEKNLAEKTKQLLLEQTGENVQVTVYGKTDEEGNICGVEQVNVTPYSEEIAEKAAEILGILEWKVVADA